MHFWKSKSTLDSLKSVVNVFWIKQSLGAPDSTCFKRQIAHSDWPTNSLKLFCFYLFQETINLSFSSLSRNLTVLASVPELNKLHLKPFLLFGNLGSISF